MGNHPALILDDAISCLGAVDLRTDEWNFDIVVTGSQKALMLPPGLGFVSVSPKAWAATLDSKMLKYYWVLKQQRRPVKRSNSIHTGSILDICA